MIFKNLTELAEEVEQVLNSPGSRELKLYGSLWFTLYERDRWLFTRCHLDAMYSDLRSKGQSATHLAKLSDEIYRQSGKFQLL